MEHPYFQQCLADVTGAIPKTWVNESYHNDACPSYSYNGWQIFIDHPDPDMRDVKEMQRFGVVVAENYGNGLGIDTPEFSSDDFQEVLNFVSKPAPKYEQDDSGNYVEVKPKEKTKRKDRGTLKNKDGEFVSSLVFRVEWDERGYPDAEPRHVTWSELEEDNDEMWNGILDEDIGDSDVAYVLANLKRGDCYTYQGDMCGDVTFRRLEEDAEDGIGQPMKTYRISEKVFYLQYMDIKASSEAEACDLWRYAVDERTAEYVQTDLTHEGEIKCEVVNND